MGEFILVNGEQVQKPDENRVILQPDNGRYTVVSGERVVATNLSFKKPADQLAELGEAGLTMVEYISSNVPENQLLCWIEMESNNEHLEQGFSTAVADPKSDAGLPIAWGSAMQFEGHLPHGMRCWVAE